MKLRIAYLVAVVDSVTVLWLLSPGFAKHVFLSVVPLLLVILAVMLAAGAVTLLLDAFPKLVLPERHYPWVAATLLVGAVFYVPKRSFVIWFVCTTALVVTATLILTCRQLDVFERRHESRFYRRSVRYDHGERELGAGEAGYG